MHWLDSKGVAGDEDPVGFSVTLQQDQYPTCLALRPDVHAELNGMGLKVHEPGSNNDAGAGHLCDEPVLHLDFPRSMLDGSNGLLVLTDGTGARIEVEIAHLFAAQDVVMTTPQPIVTAGADVALTWIIPDDWNPAAKRVLATFSYYGAATNSWVPATNTVTGRDIVVHAPTPLSAGAADLFVTLEPEMSAQRCEGPRGCSLWHQIVRRFPVQVP
jgi:hypothetical protein